MEALPEIWSIARYLNPKDIDEYNIERDKIQ